MLRMEVILHIKEQLNMVFRGDESSWLVSLTGPQGSQGIRGLRGESGIGFKIHQSYTSIALMNADVSNWGTDQNGNVCSH